MKRDGWRLALALIIVGATEYALWRRLGDVLVSLYLFVFLVVTLARWFNWPRASWFEETHLDEVRQQSGNLKLSWLSPDTPIASLRTVFGVRPYFASIIYKENTETLCNEILDGLFPKIFGYGLAFVAYLFLAMKSDHTDGSQAIEIFIKSGAFVTASMFPLLWEIARCERQ